MKKSTNTNRAPKVLKSLIDDGIVSLGEVMDSHSEHGRDYVEQTLKSLVASGRVTISELLDRAS